MLSVFIILLAANLKTWTAIVANVGKEAIVYLPANVHNSVYFSSKGANVRLLHQVAYQTVRVTNKKEFVCLSFASAFIAKVLSVQTGVKIVR